MNIKTAVNFTLNCLYPPYCIVCQVLVQPDHVLCNRCQVFVQALPPYRYPLGKKRTMVVHAAGAYQPPLDGLVRAKNRSIRSAAVPLGTLLSAYLSGLNYQYDLLIPVPLHWTRAAWRGYNQAAVIARVVSMQCALPRVQPFVRIKYTQAQQRLSKDQRMANVADAFDLATGWQGRRARQLLAGKRILLIDDVFTTGATMAALAKQIWKLNPACVHGAVACRVLD